MTGQIYLEEQNVAGGEEEKEWVFAPESDNAVILVPYQAKWEESNECFKRAMNRCGEPSFLSFTRFEVFELN